MSQSFLLMLGIFYRVKHTFFQTPFGSCNLELNVLNHVWLLSMIIFWEKMLVKYVETECRAFDFALFPYCEQTGSRLYQKQRRRELIQIFGEFIEEREEFVHEVRSRELTHFSPVFHSNTHWKFYDDFRECRNETWS